MGAGTQTAAFGRWSLQQLVQIQKLGMDHHGLK